MALSFRRIVATIGIASLLPVVAHAQESATISGHVTGEGGIALSGVAVSIPELGLGGITRDDGSYTDRRTECTREPPSGHRHGASRRVQAEKRTRHHQSRSPSPRTSCSRRIRFSSAKSS